MPTAATDPPGWSLAWSDDFTQLDQSRWTLVDTNVPTNNSQQDYLPEQVSVSGGNLVITAENSPSRGLPYRSGQVISTSEQRLGRWEVRAKLPTSRGMWPAIWLLPDTERHPWPTGGEIDIMENRGGQPNLTSSAFHYGSRDPYLHQFVYEEQQTASGSGLTNYHDSFHTYAVDWHESQLRFYVDGVHYYSVYDEDVGGFLSQNTAPMQLVINNAIGGTFLPDPDETTQWPQTMEIDWVRVYTHNPDTFEAVHTNGDFEANGGSLAGWSTFGNDLFDNPNVRIASEAVLEGSSSLKLFGTFQDQPTFSGVSQGITVQPGQEVSASLQALVRSADSIAGTDNSATLKIEFYDEFGGKFGSSTMIDIAERVFADSSTIEDTWHSSELTATVPDGAAEARLAIVFSQPGQAGGAVHVDAVRFGVVSTAASRGDFNGDGRVDAADYAAWRNTLGDTGASLPADADGNGLVDIDDLEVWRSAFGSGDAGPQTATAAPEPAIGALSLASFLGALSHQRGLRSQTADGRVDAP